MVIIVFLENSLPLTHGFAFTFKARQIPEDYAAIVKETHEKGGFGSIGYRYDWKKPEAMKNLLRTHTTAISRCVECECRALLLYLVCYVYGSCFWYSFFFLPWFSGGRGLLHDEKCNMT